MTDRPILFSAPMVRAILDGRKTQTRRVVKCAKPIVRVHPPFLDDPTWLFDHEDIVKIPLDALCDHSHVACPYGQTGDRLWVREEHYRFGHWEEVSGVKTKTGKQKFAFVPDSSEVLFDAPSEFRKARQRQDPLTPAWHKRLARFMPRSASRITLEITDVRVERLQDITDADALAEGVDQTNTSIGGYATERFKRLWESINGPDSWDANPWVWAIGFKRVEGGAS